MAWRLSRCAAALLICLMVAVAERVEPLSADSHEERMIRPNIADSPGLWGTDARTPVPERFGYLKGKIGRLVSRGGQPVNCTVFCVSADVVATASHCLFSTDNEGKRPRLTSFTVQFGADGAARTKIAGDDESSARWNVVAGTTHFPVHSPLHNARDWALLKLASNVCAKRTLPLSPVRGERELLEAVNRKQVFAVGFMRRGSSIELLYSGACETTEKIELLKKIWSNIRVQFLDPGNVVPHRCGFGPGASGSPLFLNTETEPAVIALNNGTVPVPAYLLSGKSLADRLAIIRAMPEAANIAVSAAAFARQIRLMQALPAPLSSDEIRRLQIFLGESGYFAEEADGAYSLALRQAILDFERDRDLLATGLPSLSLIGK